MLNPNNPNAELATHAYRVEDASHASLDPWNEDVTHFSYYIRVVKYRIVKHTTCGMWIRVTDAHYCPNIGNWACKGTSIKYMQNIELHAADRGIKRFVNQNATKQFAHENLSSAICAYKSRKLKQESLYRQRAKIARQRHDLAHALLSVGMLEEFDGPSMDAQKIPS